jgi:hypothetical protein
MTTKEWFIKYLKKVEILDRYEENLSYGLLGIFAGCKTVYDYVDYVPHPERWVSGAFTFRNTKEGYEFWKIVDMGWKIALKIINQTGQSSDQPSYQMEEVKKEITNFLQTHKN